jgi:hypothetical protein
LSREASLQSVVVEVERFAAEIGQRERNFKFNREVEEILGRRK